MSAITAKASRKMKKYAVLTREPRCFLGSFDFSWEQRKLGEIGSVSMCRRIFKEQTSETGDIPFYKIGTFGAEPDAFISRELFEEYKSKYPYPKKGDILISASGSIGRTVEFAGNNEYFQDSNIVWLSHDERLSNSFLKCFYSVVKWAGIEGSTIKRLYNDNILNTVICMPSVPEQEHIGLFFENLNNLITLHQRKCVFLFGLFQASISMIFTASTFSWEQRKLGDVVQITMGQSPDGSTYSDEPSDYILVQGNADLQNGWVCPRIWTTQITKKADAGDLIMSVRAPAGAMGKTAYNAVIGRGVAAIKGNEFIYQLLVKMDTDGFWKTLSCGSTFESLNSDNIKNAEVKIPTTAEQIKIGGLFQYLDNLITLHQRECISFTVRAGGLILTANKKRTTSSWEQRKLSEIADKVTEKNSGLQYVETFTNSAEFGIISQRDFFDHDIAKLSSLDGYYIVKNEDFVYNPRISTSAPVGPINRNKLGRTGVMSPLYTVFRPHDVDTTYLEHFFKCAYWHSFMNFNGDSGARSDRFSIKNDVFFQMPIPLPHIDEQRKIGELLTCLDHLITLHQRKPFLMKWRTSDANRNQTNRLVL